MGMYTDEPLFDDPKLPPGWYRKVVQRQSGATAGHWDVYVFNPDGKKFRSRNELRTFFIQSGSKLNSEDFDFSVKGKGHHNKGGKTATPKKSVTESSKENQVKTGERASVRRKSGTANKSPPEKRNNERPKRELRKRLRSSESINASPSTPPPTSSQASATEGEDEDVDDREEVSNVKLKVKVGYTATGAMIRPAANGGRKKKRRFRNLNVKKPPVKAQPKSTGSPAKRATSTATAAAKEEKKEDKPTQSPASTRASRMAEKRKVKEESEPVPGPSGLQKVKRSPRRVLKRKTGAGGATESEDDEEDLDYVCSLYPNQQAPSTENEAEPADSSKAEEPSPPVGDEETKQPEINGSVTDEKSSLLNGATDDKTLTASAVEEGQVGPMTAMDTSHVEEADSGGGGEPEQVVVIGDSVEALHNYAKPHTV